MFHIKTDAGREEIRARQLKLSRAARTLLLILEPSKATEEWMQMVRGATLDDVQGLLALGLIASRDAGADPAAEPAEADGEAQTIEVEFVLPEVAPGRLSPPAVVAAPTAPAPTPAPIRSVAAAPAAASPAAQSASGADLAHLTQRFTQLATRHLGLLESYRMVLEIERCASVAELQALAPRLLAAVERSAGAEKAQRLRTELGADLSAAPR